MPPRRPFGSKDGRGRPVPRSGSNPMSRPYHLAVLLALAGGAALSALPAAAAPAASPGGPGNAPWLAVTTGEQYVYPEFSREGQARWYRIALKQGRDYAVYGYDQNGLGTSLTLYRPNGRQPLSFGLFEAVYGSGAGFRA